MCKHIVIVGAGAAGYFLAASLPKSDKYTVTIIEKATTSLQKVRVSGGGRCNVTHACFDPKELVNFYPRGKKELHSLFFKFQPADTMNWFESRGIALKIEEDNRVFPNTDSSETIINVLQNEGKKNAVHVLYSSGIQNIKKENKKYILFTSQQKIIADIVIFTTGSSPMVWELLKNMGHRIIPPVPSLFTFNIKEKSLNDLMGISFENAEVSIPSLHLKEKGSLLITHWGLSGPAILRLSAWGAIDLEKVKYQFSIKINWLGLNKEIALDKLLKCKQTNAKKQIGNYNPFGFTQRFWLYILYKNFISENTTYADISKEKLILIVLSLCETSYDVKGKSTFKDEFVSCGGVDLKEVDFRNMQSKIHENLFFAGEVLNIDGITGGFNFQACWSEAFVISEYLKESFK